MVEPTLDEMLTSFTVKTPMCITGGVGYVPVEPFDTNYFCPSQVYVTSYKHVSEASLSEMESILPVKSGTHLY